MKDRREILSSISKNKKLTDFEKRVYKATLAIPKGEVRSYKWVAGTIGNPRSCRAVGNALNKNPYAPTVPCHRVIKSDGSVGGFALGLKMKRRLLKREGIDLR
jgi:O-6-methylguanine DNA methyltransferase